MEKTVKELQKLARENGFILISELAWNEALNHIESLSERHKALLNSNNNLRKKIKDYQTKEISHLKARRDDLLKENKMLRSKLKKLSKIA